MWDKRRTNFGIPQKAASPLCDLIIITWNGLEDTKKCLESVEKNTKNVSYKYIFIDNNSTDGTVEYLKKFDNSLLIENKENLGFVKAMNQGLEKASAKFTVWLNNDTIVTPNWLRYLVKHMEKNPEIGAIGPMSNATGVMQRDELWDSEVNLEDISSYGDQFHSKNKNQLTEYHRISGFCIIMKSKLISEIGYLDEKFNFGGFDDDDFCKRVRNKGHKIAIARDVFIYHKSGAAFSRIKDPNLNLLFLMQKGRRNFLSKWNTNESKTNAKNPLVSVIIATKDRKNVISNAIKSVLSQTYKNFELIVINDGGGDIQSIIAQFNDARIKYIALENNEGKSYANNYAIEKSQGEIIAYLDDDDIWYENHLEVTVNELTKFKSRKLVYTDYVQVDCIANQNGKQFPIKKELIELKDAKYFSLDKMNFIPNFSVVHKRSLFKTEKFDEALDFYEDWDLLRRFSKHTYFVHIPKATGEYWINQVGLTRNSAALVDKNLDTINRYIISKNITTTNQILLDLYSADELVKSTEWKRALSIYKKILKQDPEFFPALEGCADRLYNMQQYDECIKILDIMLKLNPYRLSMYILQSHALMENGEYERTKEGLELALIISDDKSCYYLLQDCYKKLNNIETSDFIKKQTAIIVENINMKEVEEFLINLYTTNKFYRKLFVLGFKILKKIHK